MSNLHDTIENVIAGVIDYAITCSAIISFLVIVSIMLTAILYPLAVMAGLA